MPAIIGYMMKEDAMNNASKAWDNGRYAGHKGQPVTDNPFNPETEKFGYNEWVRGWNAGQYMKQDLIQYGAE
jgi:hypothetical protein